MNEEVLPPSVSVPSGAAQWNLPIPSGKSDGATVLLEAKTNEWHLTAGLLDETLYEEVLRLRKKVYVDEWQIMNETEIVSPNDRHGIHVLLRDLKTGELAGCTHMIEAEQSDFGPQSGLSAEALSAAIYSSRSTVAKEYRKKGVFQALGQTATRWYRMQGRKYVVSYLQEGDHPTHRRFLMKPIPGARNHLVRLQNRADLLLRPYAETVEFIMYRGGQDVSPDLQEVVGLLAASEIRHSVSRMAEKVNGNALWRHAAEGTLTKFQYAEALAQLHHFVRYTTRIIAKALSLSEDKVLRSHFRKHMLEESDHELIIESDLQALGMDVEYFVHQKAAHPGIWNFNGLQESLLGYRQDPVLYMAVPFAVEGLSAFVNDENMRHLDGAVKSWGIANPKTVTAFLASHRNFDGGDGGHWDMTLGMIRRFVQTEAQTKQFLAIARATTDNILSMLEDTLDGRDWTRWHMIGDVVPERPNVH